MKIINTDVLISMKNYSNIVDLMLILLNACWKFRKLYMESTGPDNPIDPFDYITIASLCMGTFRANFLPEKWKILTKSKA